MWSFDPVEARRFLEALMTCARDGDHLDTDLEVEVRPLWPKPRSGRAGGYTAGQTIPQVLQLAEAQLQRRADVYVGFNPRIRGSTSGTCADVGAVIAAVADVDWGKNGCEPEQALEAARRAPWGPPSIVVGSGGGFHLYWLYGERLNADVETKALHKAVCDDIAQWLDAEVGMNVTDGVGDAPRILRLPGTRNFKPERATENGGEPPLVRLVECHPERRYRPVDVAAHLPSQVAARQAKRGAVRELRPVSPMPTDVPENLRRVVAATGAEVKVIREGVGVRALRLLPCPACGSAGRCYLTLSGRLKTFRARRCAASSSKAGLALDTWVPKFAPAAVALLGGPRLVSAKQQRRAARFEQMLAALPALLPTAPIQRLSVRARKGAATAGGLLIPPLAECAAGSFAAMLAAKACPEGSGLLVVRDALGRARQGVVLGTGELLPPSVAFSAADDAVAGQLLVLGDLPRAVLRAAGGEPLFIAHGLLEFLELVGLLADTSEQGAVLGVVGDPAVLAAHLATEWVTRAQLPPRVVIVGGRSSVPSDFAAFNGLACTDWIGIGSEISRVERIGENIHA